MPFGSLDIEEMRNCSQCGDRFNYSEFGFHCDYCGGVHCDDCYECSDNYDDERCGCGCQNDNDDHVRPWNYRPRPYMPKGDYPDAPLLGVELEVGGRARSIVEAVHTVDDNEGHLYMKEDGSISGVEIVTHPMTLEWSKSFDFEKLLENLRVNGSHVDDGYGLHVHVSRNAFRRGGKPSEQHAMAWLLFMSRNAESLQELARRVSGQWAAFNEPMPGELRKKAIDAPYSDNRYVAVNCNNERTYELRFFRSTLDVQELRAAMEFASASVEYTRGMSASRVLKSNGLTFKDFATWLHGERDIYPNLVEEIARLELGEESTSIVRTANGSEGFGAVTDIWQATRQAARMPGYFGPRVQRGGITYDVYRSMSGTTSLRRVEHLGALWESVSTFIPEGWQAVL